MEGFLRRFEPVDRQDDPDSSFDQVIDLDVSEDSRHNLELIVNALHDEFPKLVPTVPSAEELDKAIEAALTDYAPDIKHEISSKSGNRKYKPHNGNSSLPIHSLAAKAPKIEYFCLRIPTQPFLSALESTFKALDTNTSRFFSQLQQTRRIQTAFHVTLIHRASLSQNPQNQELWDSLTAKYEAAKEEAHVADPVFGKCRVLLDRVLWDNRLMCAAVRLLDEGWRTVNSVAHVTVGTAGQGIKPKESNDLLVKWMREGATAENGIREVSVRGGVEVWGEAKGVTPLTR